MKKLVFFVKNGLDSFLGDIVSELSKKYTVKKVVVNYYNQIDEEMKLADICWFEWCDDLIVYGSKLGIVKEKIIICRLHSYEVFTEYINQVNWKNVDKLICVGKNIRDILKNKISIEDHKISVIQNGIDENKYSYKERNSGFNIAYVGYINFKKGPMLLIHTFKAIHDRDEKYKLHIAGTFQDERYVLYFSQMIKKMHLEGSVIYDGWQDNLNKWLEDKNYILCTSVLESQNLSVMQAMSKGIKPIIHNFVGAEDIYPRKYIWNTIDEAVNMVCNYNYNSKEYRNFIIDNYSLNVQQNKILKLMDDLTRGDEINLIQKPLITVGIINYNYGMYLDKSIESVLKQNYDNIEILIVDDFSKDGSINKIKEYESKYKNVRGIYHFENSGSAVLAFQDIIKNANGKYMMFLSADDYLYDDSVLEKYVNEFAKNSDLDYVYGDIQLVDQKENEIGTWQYKDYTDEEVIYKTFRNMGSGVIPLTCGMFKMSFYKKNNLTFIDDKQNRVAGDTLNTLVYLKYGFKRKHVELNSICYRQHSNNMTYDLKNRIKSIISVMEYVVNNFNVEIIFPEVNWQKYDHDEKESVKMYVIGNYYWLTLASYYNKKIKLPIDFDVEQVREFIQPLIPVVEKYFNKCLQRCKKFDIEIQKIREQIDFIKIYKIYVTCDPKKYDIYTEGIKLRENLMNCYKDKYLDKKLKALILSPQNGAWKYIFDSWKDILEYMGVSTTICENVSDNILNQNFDVFISIADKYYIDVMFNNKSIACIPHKIGIAAKNVFFGSSEVDKQDLINIDLVNHFKYDFLISTFSESSIKYVFKKWIQGGIKVRSITYGFNPLIHYPEKIQEIYDYFFVGSNSYLKAKETQKYLLNIVNNYKGILRGENWSKDIPNLSPANSRFFYNRAKINLNYHLESQKQHENEINERTFIICACGGFQLVDNPKMLKNYYNDAEIAVANDEKEYLDKFIYYLNKPDERHDMAYKAMVKTYDNKSSLFHRMEKILNNVL